MIRKAAKLAFGLAAVLLSSCETLNDALDELEKEHGKKDRSIPEQINFTQERLYPEGVAFDKKNGRFLVTSLTRGTVGAVAYDGTYKPFIQDSALGATIGIKVDEARKRVLVAVSNPSLGNVASLGIYDLSTGNRLHFVNLLEAGSGPRNFANDITLDPQGNAYVTNSFSPIIYKVDRNGNASVFFRDEAFTTAPGEFGFNGIAYHPSGYLIVAFSKESALYRIPLNDPTESAKIQLDAPLQGPDGLLLSKDGKQLVVGQQRGGAEAGRVLSFVSDDKWGHRGTRRQLRHRRRVSDHGHQRRQGHFRALRVPQPAVHPALTPQNTFTIRKVPFGDNRPF
jgi:sugar lactone lactonase YvrE